MRQVCIILAICITLVRCNDFPVNFAHPKSKENSSDEEQDSTFEDSIVILNPNPDSTHFSGSIKKISYPSHLHKCMDSLTDYSFDCLGARLKIHVPCYYLRTDYLEYTEGQILTIHYPDSSSISILCGSLADLSIEDHKADGLFSKKVIVNGYQITYSNVPKRRLILFNTAFELLKKDIK